MNLQEPNINISIFFKSVLESQKSTPVFPLETAKHLFCIAIDAVNLLIAYQDCSPDRTVCSQKSTTVIKHYYQKQLQHTN